MEDKQAQFPEGDDDEDDNDWAGWIHCGNGMWENYNYEALVFGTGALGKKKVMSGTRKGMGNTKERANTREADTSGGPPGLAGAERCRACKVGSKGGWDG